MDSSSENVDPTATYWIHRWEYRPMPMEVAILASVFSALFGVFGALANGLVMYLIIQIKRSNQLEHLDIFILSLCFSDFLSSIFVQPVLIPVMLASSHASSLHAHLLHASTHFTLVLGSLSLLAITFNRYFSIKSPFYYAQHFSELKIYGCLVAIFLVAISMVIWVLLDGKSESAAFPIIISVIVSITIVLQVMIFRIVQSQNRNMRRQIMAVQHNQTDISHVTRRRNVQRSKTNKTILYICVVFIATWLPSVIFRVYFLIHGNITFYLQWLSIFNLVIQLHSCINPWLYVLRTSRVKQVLIRIYQRQ